MEGKNKKNLIVWLFVIIIILLVVAVGTLIFKNSNINDTQIMEGTNNNQVDNSNDEVVEEIPQNNNNVNNENNNINELTEARALELAKRVLENGRGSSDEVVKVLYGEYIQKTDEKFTNNSCNYMMTSVNYNDFKNEALKSFSENYFNTLNSFKGMIIAIENNGKVAILDGTWSGVGHQVKDIKLDKKENDVYYYTVNATMQAGAYTNEVSYNMEIKLVNGYYVIDSLVQNVQQNNVTNENTNGNTNELTDERVHELVKRVLENSRGSSDSVVKVMCGYEIANNGKQYTDATTSSLYNLSDVSYTKFKIEVLKNFSEKYFEELNNFKGRKIVIEKDGYVGVLEGTWSGIVHEIKSVKLTKTENNVYYYTVRASYKQGEIPVDIMYDFGIKLIDDNYVIDSMITKYVN